MSMEEGVDLQKYFQQFMQKGFVVLVPFILIGGALITAIWRFTIEKSYDYKGLKGFMVLTVLQLLPLAVLKVKTWICSDRVSLVPLALVKTMIMHVFLQCTRLASPFFETFKREVTSTQQLEFMINTAAIIALLYLLHKEFHMPLSSVGLQKVFTQHKDVMFLLLGACTAGTMTEVIYPSTWNGSVWIANIIVSSANFLEILSFMPVVSAVCLETGVETYTPGTSVQDTERRKVKIFFAFILTFYFWDDLMYCMLMGEDALVLAPKCAHYCMLLDFAGFFILKVGAAPKAVHDMLPSVLESQVETDLPKRDESMQGLLCEDDDYDDDAF